MKEYSEYHQTAAGRAEAMLEEIGHGLTDTEIAQCLYMSMLDTTSSPFQVLGTKKVVSYYLEMMQSLHIRIFNNDNSVGEFGCWLWVKGYWPLPVVGAKG